MFDPLKRKVWFIACIPHTSEDPLCEEEMQDQV